jgi:hypothetical protein
MLQAESVIPASIAGVTRIEDTAKIEIAPLPAAGFGFTKSRLWLIFSARGELEIRRRDDRRGGVGRCAFDFGV